MGIPEKYYCSISDEYFTDPPKFFKENQCFICARPKNCPYIEIVLVRNKETIKPEKSELAKGEPWRAEAPNITKTPFTQKQYAAMEKLIKPINGFDLKSKVKEAAIWFLAFRSQSEGRPRRAKIKRDLKKIRKMAGELSDFLIKKADDETLLLLGILSKIYNYEDDVYKIYMSAFAELHNFKPDRGGPRPWETDAQRAYFISLGAIYENGTGISLKRVINPMEGTPTKKYKRVLDFFRLCWEPVNPGDKKLSDAAIDSKLKFYFYLEPTKK